MKTLQNQYINSKTLNSKTKKKGRNIVQNGISLRRADKLRASSQLDQSNYVTLDIDQLPSRSGAQSIIPG